MISYKVSVTTPFRQIAIKIGDLLQGHYHGESNDMSGTVHTFQSKEEENVILLLGGDSNSTSVISSFASARPNLVNVAVTRAKRGLYVTGDFSYWTGTVNMHRIYNRMAENLEHSN